MSELDAYVPLTNDEEAGLRASVESLGTPGDLRWTNEAMRRVLATLDAERTALRKAAEPILDRCLDFFGADDLDPESSEAMPVVIKNRWVYALRSALAADGSWEGATDE